MKHSDICCLFSHPPGSIHLHTFILYSTFSRYFVIVICSFVGLFCPHVQYYIEEGDPSSEGSPEVYSIILPAMRVFWETFSLLKSTVYGQRVSFALWILKQTEAMQFVILVSINKADLI